MSSILQKILDTKKEEIAALESQRSELESAAYSTPSRASFFDALKNAPAPGLIAEVKKASPSKGLIRSDFDPVSIAKSYAAGGANCLSVLTDQQYFQGHLDFLNQISKSVSLPLLRKDFIIDPLQIFEAKINGASAILLIAAALEDNQLGDLFYCARDLKMDVLLEVHHLDELLTVERSGISPRIVGINNRNLNSFEVELAVTQEMVPELPESAEVIVSESGIFTCDDVATVMSYGATAILVGESLMRQENVELATRRLLSLSEKTI